MLALLRAMATESPGGQRARFGNAVRAAYLRVELGDGSGNLFCPAFTTPIPDAPGAINALRAAASREEVTYALHRQVFEFSVPEGLGSLDAVIAAVCDAISERPLP